LISFSHYFTLPPFTVTPSYGFEFYFPQ